MCNIQDIVATHRHLKVLGGTMQMECLQFQGKETWQINFMGNHQNENWWLPAFFAIPAKQECISTHKVRAQLGVEDDILRGLGMCLQQAKCAACTQGYCLLTCEATTNVFQVFYKFEFLRWSIF